MGFQHQVACPQTERLVLLLVLGLHRQPSHLGLQLGDQVGDPGQVVARSAQPAERLVLAHLEVLYTRGLFKQLAALLGPQRKGRVDGALAHDDQLVGAQTALPEQLDDIAEPSARPVDQVLGLPRPVGAPADRHLAVVNLQPPIGVVERQHHLGHALRAAVLRAREDDVVGAPRAKGAIRLLAEDPAHGIGHVALAAAVRPDDGVDA